MTFRLSSLIILIFSLCSIFTVSCYYDEDDDDDDDTTSYIYTRSTETAVDSVANVFIAGYTYGSLDDQVHQGSADIFLKKFNASGTRLWTYQVGTSSADYMEGMVTSSSGETYMVGYTYGALSDHTSQGGVDTILIKTDGDGNKLWDIQTGTSANDYGFGVTVDSSGNVFIVGYTYGSLAGTITGSKDLFLIKYNSSGIFQWAKQMGCSHDDTYSAADGAYAIDVQVDSTGNIYVAGFTSGNMEGNSLIGGYDLFAVKFDSIGNQLWVKQLGTTANEFLSEMVVSSSGEVYLTGYTAGTFTDQTTYEGYDLFLLKLSTEGALEWTKQLGTDADEFSKSITSDSSGNIYLTGYTSGSLISDTTGGYDLLIYKYDSAGTLLLSFQTGSAASDCALGIITDSSNQIFLTGYTYGDLNSEDNTNDYASFVSLYNATGTHQWTSIF